MSLVEFACLLGGMAGYLKVAGKEVAEDLEVPYWEPCEESKLDGPDCFVSVPVALKKFESDRLVAVYVHTPTLNLVLVGLSGAKVGVRSTEFQLGRLPMLISGLKEYAGIQLTA